MDISALLASQPKAEEVSRKERSDLVRRAQVLLGFILYIFKDGQQRWCFLRFKGKATSEERRSKTITVIGDAELLVSFKKKQKEDMVIKQNCSPFPVC